MTLDLARDAWFLVGPTAAGKTAAGIEVARLIEAEIISLDSMALYRGMDIGTAKPTPAQRSQVPHHLLDVFDPSEECSLARYVEMARECTVEIIGRSRQVLFVGGTPLYLKALLRGIFHGPPADWAFRRRLIEESRQHEPQWLHQRLQEVDPATALRLHPNDQRRIIRALEVFELTGTPISQLQQQFEIGRAAEECRVFVLDWPRAELHARIDCRVDEMFAAGLVEEVRSLLSECPHSRTGATAGLSSSEVAGRLPHTTAPRGYPASSGTHVKRLLGRTARQAVGYRETIEHIEGQRGLAETIGLVKLRTRQLAKRQCTWFRSLSECRFVPVSGQPDAIALARCITAME